MAAEADGGSKYISFKMIKYKNNPVTTMSQKKRSRGPWRTCSDLFIFLEKFFRRLCRGDKAA
ncbi:hypothetical protein VK70_16825 [Paenibacillus durus ATCC 35681]|uniref:Uncharacterized protein n=1 Tax=Paenibacillus durus ATCC 35681 TaxID=1333534 RepID=A0A0F7FB85_PAEDU|nr:hypothetical protein VK70_16825 [Paenibacillus durus ATCC 35681]